jgi:hypothetical protein
MNGRIKELLYQANLLDDDGWSTSNLTRDVEQFAELVIQECIDQIESYQIPVGNSPAGELASEWTYDALSTIRDNIKEHLGIKPCE